LPFFLADCSLTILVTGDMDNTLPEVAKPNRVPVVQFAATTFYVREGERLRLVVQRMGPCCASVTSSVDWATKPSPFEGKKFQASSGTLTFEPGDLFDECEVQLLDDDVFGSALQFRVELKKPSGCTLGGTYADVMAADNDVFPTNRYREKVEEDRTTESWQEGESWTMFKEFAKFIYRHTPGSKKVLLSDQVDNLIFISEIVVMRLLVNALSTDEAGHWIRFMRFLRGKDVEGRVSTTELNTAIICFGLFLLVPYVITHWLAYKRTTWKVTGGARAVLQENLLRKYLSQDESSSFASTTFFLDTFGHDVGDLVVNGYNKLFVVAKSIGRLVCAFALTLFYAAEAKVDKGVNLAFMGLLPFVVLPVCISIMLAVRSKLNMKAREAVQDAEDDMLSKVDKSTDCYRMVADMDTRTLVVSDCLQDIKKLNAALAKCAGLMANNRSVVHWATEALLFLWIAIAGHAVAVSLRTSDGDTAKEMDLGTFLAILNLIKSNGSEFENLFTVWLEMEKNYPVLWSLVKLMNLNSDVDLRIEQQQTRICAGEAFVKEAHELLTEVDLEGGSFPEDDMPLTFEAISFAYPKGGTPAPKASGAGRASRRSTRRSTIGKQVTAMNMPFAEVDGFTKKIQQGSLIAFTGPRGSGKSTILKLIGEVLIPFSGNISIPPYLRILHVSAESMIWPGTVAENIFFGVCASRGMNTDGYATLDGETLERGWHVCRVLNFPEHLQKLAEDLETDKELFPYMAPASHRKLIHLARAFICNPEVLVLHEPTFFLPKELCVVVMDALREFVTNRGLVPDKEDVESRRPRTVLFSSVEPLDLTYADDIVNMAPVDDETGDIVDSVMLENTGMVSGMLFCCNSPENSSLGKLQTTGITST